MSMHWMHRERPSMCKTQCKSLKPQTYPRIAKNRNTSTKIMHRLSIYYNKLQIISTIALAIHSDAVDVTNRLWTNRGVMCIESNFTRLKRRRIQWKLPKSLESIQRVTLTWWTHLPGMVVGGCERSRRVFCEKYVNYYQRRPGPIPNSCSD